MSVTDRDQPAADLAAEHQCPYQQFMCGSDGNLCALCQARMDGEDQASGAALIAAGRANDAWITEVGVLLGSLAGIAAEDLRTIERLTANMATAMHRTRALDEECAALSDRLTARDAELEGARDSNTRLQAVAVAALNEVLLRFDFAPWCPDLIRALDCLDTVDIPNDAKLGQPWRPGDLAEPAPVEESS